MHLQNRNKSRGTTRPAEPPGRRCQEPAIASNLYEQMKPGGNGLKNEATTSVKEGTDSQERSGESRDATTEDSGKSPHGFETMKMSRLFQCIKFRLAVRARRAHTPATSDNAGIDGASRASHVQTIAPATTAAVSPVLRGFLATDS